MHKTILKCKFCGWDPLKQSIRPPPEANPKNQIRAHEAHCLTRKRVRAEQQQQREQILLAARIPSSSYQHAGNAESSSSSSSLLEAPQDDATINNTRQLFSSTQEERWRWGQQELRQQQQNEELVGASSFSLSSSSSVGGGVRRVLSTHMLAMSGVNSRLTRSQATRGITRTVQNEDDMGRGGGGGGGGGGDDYENWDNQDEYQDDTTQLPVEGGGGEGGEIRIPSILIDALEIPSHEALAHQKKCIEEYFSGKKTLSNSNIRATSGFSTQSKINNADCIELMNWNETCGGNLSNASGNALFIVINNILARRGLQQSLHVPEFETVRKNVFKCANELHGAIQFEINLQEDEWLNRDSGVKLQAAIGTRFDPLKLIAER